MQFSVLNCLLTILILITNHTQPQEATSFVRNPSKYLLNEVSDFDEIVEKENRGAVSSLVKISTGEEDTEPHLENNHNFDFYKSNKNQDNALHEDNHDTVPSSNNVFSYVAPTGELAYNKRNARDRSKSSLNANVVGRPIYAKKLTDSDSQLEQDDSKAKEYDDSGEDNGPNLVADNDAVGFKENTNRGECSGLNDLLPIPFLESILINRLLETDMMSSKPHKYKLVVKNVLPQYKNLYKLDNPENIRCLRRYLERRKRETKITIKKRKKKKKKPKHRHRENRDADLNQAQFASMLQYIGQNQTFNESFTYIPVLFATAHPTENQFILAGVEENASDDEKRLVGKLLNHHPGLDISLNKSECPTKQLQGYLEVTSKPSTVENPPNKPSNIIADNKQINSLQEAKALTHELDSKIPEITKNLMEVMQRQQNPGTNRQPVKGNRRFKKDAPVLNNLPQVPPNVGSNGQAGPQPNVLQSNQSDSAISNGTQNSTMAPAPNNNNSNVAISAQNVSLAVTEGASNVSLNPVQPANGTVLPAVNVSAPVATQNESIGHNNTLLPSNELQNGIKPAELAKPEISELQPVQLNPGILIYQKTKQVKRAYPKGPIRTKKYAYNEVKQNTDVLLDDLHLDRLLDKPNPMSPISIEKKNANDLPACDVNKSKCAAETDRMLDIIQNIKQESLSQKLSGQIEYTQSTTAKGTSSGSNIATTKAGGGINPTTKSNVQAQRSINEKDLKAKINRLQSDLQLVHEIQGILNKLSPAKKNKRQAPQSFRGKNSAFSHKQAKAKTLKLIEDDGNSKFDQEVKGLGKIRALLTKHRTGKSPIHKMKQGENSRFLGMG